MDTAALLRDFAFSKYESTCYLTLLAHHPSNGSQLSKLSGIARSRIYDVLRTLSRKGVVFEITPGQYVPLPFEELKKRLRSQFETNLTLLEDTLNKAVQKSDHEYLFTINGYKDVIAKAEDIIGSVKQELYLRLFPGTWQTLEGRIADAVTRGVGVRMVSMGVMPLTYDIQVVHPHADTLPDTLGGESIDIIADKSEALVGIIEADQKDTTPIIWTRNRWFVTANRDSVRHDFYHCFLNKIYDRGEQLSAREKKIYEFIKKDD